MRRVSPFDPACDARNLRLAEETVDPAGTFTVKLNAWMSS
jgi:hypothetical protein